MRYFVMWIVKTHLNIRKLIILGLGLILLYYLLNNHPTKKEIKYIILFILLIKYKI